MPVYYYQALNEQGKKRKGFIEALSESEAKAKLRDQGILITSISSTPSKGKKQQLSSDQLLNFTSMLSQLISSGIPLYESLLTIEEQLRDEPHHRIIVNITDQVKAGMTLSDAMKQFPNSFNQLYTSMIGAGEAAGALDIVTKRLASFLSRQAKLRKQIANALIYPAILASFALAVIILLMGFVVPSIEGIFEGRELNRFTEAVLGTSQFLRHYWFILLPLLGLTIGAIVYALWRPEGRRWIQIKLMKIPYIRDLLIQAAIVRFARTMSTLQEGGLPLVEAISLSKGVMQNVLMEEEVARAEKKILEGGTLSTEFKRSHYLPPMTARMIAIGEETGHLGPMLGQIADIYEENLEKTIERVMSLLQPAILLIMGAIIGLVLLAILLPMTDVSSLT